MDHTCFRHLQDRFCGNIVHGERADRGKGQGQLIGWDADHRSHLHRIPDFMTELNARSLHRLGGVRKRMPEHVHRHHLIGYIGRRKEWRYSVAVWQCIEKTDGIDAILFSRGMTCTRPRIEDIPGAAEIMEIQISTAKLIDLSIAAADAGTLVRFGDAVHDKLGRETYPVAIERTASIGQDVQSGLDGSRSLPLRSALEVSLRALPGYLHPIGI